MREAREWKEKIQAMEKKLTEKRQEENKIAGLKLPASLDKLMKTDLLGDVSAEDVGKLWTKYWSDRETISAIITTGDGHVLTLYCLLLMWREPLTKFTRCTPDLLFV